ncbi:acetolactate synthase, large subunit, biosynthetic type [Methanoregula boonei 6A8]|jgi:acetolactate synthase-1/2/3 large subunit|uniref:Acetolactate synthase n=1 Tax=Methanoregula boonei (strain DSM 21154 / JCM 14090 / 6A8) TaxID=456442 RepID=A7I8A0_METB6|nr:biosynthetic-type acetolactate synthase large subunit [Methanoregula boonei]ABS55961.1 acetolactate synthase, large subunit, biosynthetic type [Methanoregula boonei 6A8]
MKTGAKLLVESLQREGVDTLFGYPGGSVLPIYDELYDSPLRHILVRHEQAAAHAADGYARASGRVGVCLATSGPGACNLVTGIATAYMDSVPVVAITGQVPTTMLGNDAFQESDIQGITMPITKHNYLVKETSDIPRVVQEAFYIAGTGRQGPVLIDLPKDVNTRSVKEPIVPEKVVLRGYNPTYKGHKRQIDKAIELITTAERPLIYAGGGVISSNASPELVAFASTHGIPVTTTLMGIGCIPCDHPLNMGMLGMHGTEYANFAVTECDLLIAIGARFDDRVTGKIDTFAPNAKVIHIDIDPAEIGKNKRVDVPIVGDTKAVLTDIIAGLAKKNASEAWQKRIKHWKQNHPLRYGKDNGCLHPQFILQQMNELLKGDAVIVSEVGQNQMWTAQYFCFRHPRTWITSGGLGTMGYGFPAAIGAHFARPDVPVFDVAGDGSIQMNIQEMGTVAQYNIPVKIAILNNMYLGMVRQWQELFYDRRYAYTELPPVEFVRIGQAYGIEGIKVESCDEVMPALKAAVDHDGPFVLDFRIEREENVFPMVPAGAAINEMIGGHPPS